MALGALALASLGGCANFRRATGLDAEALNVESPAAGAVMTVQSERFAYPHFYDVPAKPPGLHAPQGFARTVASLNGERRDLNGWVADNPAGAGDTEGYAASAREKVGATPADAPQQDLTPAISAWAARMRAAAKAPVPPQKPPVPADPNSP